jgi:hypothetical protein
LLGEHALFKGQLFVAGHVLHATATATAKVWARSRASQGAGVEYAFSAGFDDLAVRAEHARFYVFALQAASDKPGATVDKADTAPVVGQSLNVQSLFFTGWDLRCPGAATGLETQARITLGHQLGAS